MKTKERLFHFHVGRGGRFNNFGFLRFKGEVDSITDTAAFNELYPPRYKNGNDNLRTLSEEWLDCNGNSVELTNRDVKNGYGRIDNDGGYDTTYVTKESDLTSDEILLMYRDGFFDYYMEKEFLAKLLDITEENLLTEESEGCLFEYIKNLETW